MILAKNIYNWEVNFFFLKKNLAIVYVGNPRGTPIQNKGARFCRMSSLTNPLLVELHGPAFCMLSFAQSIFLLSLLSMS